MSYGMSQRRFVESMEDMDKQFIHFRNISYDHTHLHDHTHLPLGQEKFACNDLPSSSIDEAAITRYCKVFENEAATNFCVDSVLHVLTLQQKTNLNSSLLMDATTNIERDLREFDAAFEEFSRSLERKKVSTELSSNSKVDVIISFEQRHFRAISNFQLRSIKIYSINDNFKSFAIPLHPFFHIGERSIRN